MMDGRNCNGRKISLLNDSSDVAAFPTKIQLPPLTAHSRAASSCESTPSLSPQTPQLVRSSSSDSRSFATPSPLTPSYNAFDNPTLNNSQNPQEQHYYIANHSYSKMDDQNGSMYPPIPDATGMMRAAYPMPPQIQQQMPSQTNQQTQRSSNSPSSEPSRMSTVSATSNPKSQPKKNQYPCPMAKQVGCSDFFTTSGHAARHAKKHTGKKDAFCPECNKAFTRKDNMEQHRRTHQNGRGSRSSANNNNADDSKVKKTPKPPAKKSAAKVEPQQLGAAVEELVAQQQSIVQAPIQQQIVQAQQAQVLQQLAMEQGMIIPPAGPYFLGTTVDSGPVPALPMAVPDMGLRPPLHRSSLANNLDYIPPGAPMMVADPDMHYSYPSPGLSNGLNSLALAASEHRRLLEEKSQSRSPQESPSQETHSEGSP